MKSTRIQQARRTNPYPWTWEIPAAITVTILLAMCLAVHVARTTANLLAGDGWRMTPRAALFSALPKILGGDPTAGLAEPPSAVASSGGLWVSIAVTELLLFLIAGLALRIGLRQWGPGRIHGMATPAEAEQLLGLTRLRRNAPVIRPDLHRETRR